MDSGIDIIIMSIGKNLHRFFLLEVRRGLVKSEEPLLHEAGGGPKALGRK